MTTTLALLALLVGSALFRLVRVARSEARRRKAEQAACARLSLSTERTWEVDAS